MNAQTKQKPTGAEDALAAAYEERRGDLPGGKALARLREEAMDRFRGLGLPHRRIEEWHYTDLKRALGEDAAAPARAARVDLAGIVPSRAFAGMDPARLVFVAGKFDAGLSDLEGLGDGIEVHTLAAGDLPDWAVKELALRRPSGDNAVFDLGMALMTDGAVIRVAADRSPARPVEIVSVCGGGGSHLRHIVMLEPGASLPLIEVSAGEGALSVETTTFHVAERARLDHVKVQGTGEATTHLAPMVAHVGAEARVNTFTLTLGGGLVREERHVRFLGEGTVASISGAFLLRGRTHADMTLQVDHEKGGCESREVFKGILDGQARSVVQNRVVVAQHAQKTDARQAVHALILSEEAEHNTKPELEIYADDVQCAHGATIGELDDDALFYLMARGVPRVTAEGMLIEAFVSGAMDEIEDEAMRDAVMALARARLGERKADG